ncbi:hypothetical protein NVP1170O_114 [Vibrio phage 1.170.O._10N.261.52.C3]|nr:hypothetical protein NVP1170O_114 [Vibrio phage 1.170.O._10N.261.52.C3]
MNDNYVIVFDTLLNEWIEVDYKTYKKYYKSN